MNSSVSDPGVALEGSLLGWYDSKGTSSRNVMQIQLTLVVYYLNVQNRDGI